MTDYLREWEKKHVNIKSSTDVLDTVKKHLEESVLFSNKEYRPKGGVHIKPKPKNIRLDVLILNILQATYYKETKKAKGYININIQDEDKERIEQLFLIIVDIMDDAFRDGYLFNVDYDTDSNAFRISRTLWLNNVKVEFMKEKYKL